MPAMLAPLVLGGLSALGGIFGRRKKKYMDPAMYNQLFGAKAIGNRTQELVNQIANSPYGQQLMQSAAEQGQALQTGLNRGAAVSGFGPAGGAQSGASDFGVAAAPAAVGALQRGVTSNLWANAMPIAQGMVQREGNIALGNLAEQNEEPTLLGRVGNAASAALAGMQPGDKMDWASMLKKMGQNPMALNTLGGGGNVTPVA
jgi:hypothetical protein